MSKIMAAFCVVFLSAAMAQAGSAEGPKSGAGSGGSVELIRFRGGEQALIVAAISGGGNVRVYDSSGRLVRRANAEGPKWDIVWMMWTPEQTEEFRIEIGAGQEHVFKTN